MKKRDNRILSHILMTVIVLSLVTLLSTPQAGQASSSNAFRHNSDSYRTCSKITKDLNLRPFQQRKVMYILENERRSSEKSREQMERMLNRVKRNNFRVSDKLKGRMNRVASDLIYSKYRTMNHIYGLLGRDQKKRFSARTSRSFDIRKYSKSSTKMRKYLRQNPKRIERLRNSDQALRSMILNRNFSSARANKRCDTQARILVHMMIKTRNIRLLEHYVNNIW